MGATPEQVVAAQRDPEALARLCEENAGLVHDAVHRFLRAVGNSERTNGGLEREDLEQVAWVGFLVAVKRYDPTRGTAFSTYAVPTMAGYLNLAHRGNQPGGVHLPRTHFEAGARVDAWSLDAPVHGIEDGEPLSLGETLAGDPDPAEGWADAADAQTAMAALRPRTRAVARATLIEDMTQEEAAALIGVTQAQVSRLARSARRALRRLLAPKSAVAEKAPRSRLAPPRGSAPRLAAEARWMLEHRATLAAMAAHFGISPKTAWRDMSEYLPQADPEMHRQVAALLAVNAAEKSRRGGAVGARKQTPADVLLAEATWALRNRASIRQMAAHFGASEMTIWRHMTLRLPSVNAALAADVSSLFAANQRKAREHGTALLLARQGAGA